MLTKKQKELAAALCDAAESEREILQRFHMKPGQLQRLLKKPAFQDELNRINESSLQETRRILTRNAPRAALMLVSLLGQHDKPDIVRRAALDLVDRCLELQKKEAASTAEGSDLSDEQARKAIVALAQSWTT
jgi:hypothetical protein